MEIRKLLRPHLLSLSPYSSARDEFSGKAEVYLDANENAFGSATKDVYRRYPDPYQHALKEKIAQLKKASTDQIFLGNGSDEPIDLLIRAFCNPTKDGIIISPPTYGMYEVSANINDVGVIKVPQNMDYSLNIEAILESIAPGIKIIFLCSPNNPTGMSIPDEDIVRILEKHQGILVLDEAYIDFSPHRGMLSQIQAYPNLVILQTFSKAWGMAALRLGMAFANPEIIDVLNMIKPPYNINGATQSLALEALDHHDKVAAMLKQIKHQKKHLISMIQDIPGIIKIFPSDANFILVKIKRAHEIYQHLIEKQVIVRDRSGVTLCDDCLRITIGTDQENKKLIRSLKEISL